VPEYEKVHAFQEYPVANYSPAASSDSVTQIPNMWNKSWLLCRVQLLN